MSKTIVTLTGPTCSGKSTLRSKLIEAGLSGIVTFTTRQPREGEVNAKDYYFIDEAKYEDLLKGNQLVEHVEQHGNHYGIFKKEIVRAYESDRNIVVVVEPRGVKQISEFCHRDNLKHIAVYIDNPEFVIYKRFLDRFKEDESATTDKYAFRLSNLTQELTTWKSAFRYTMMFSQFGPQNEVSVVRNIMNEIKT